MTLSKLYIVLTIIGILFFASATASYISSRQQFGTEQQFIPEMYAEFSQPLLYEPIREAIEVEDQSLFILARSEYRYFNHTGYSRFQTFRFNMVLIETSFEDSSMEPLVYNIDLDPDDNYIGLAHDDGTFYTMQIIYNHHNKSSSIPDKDYWLLGFNRDGSIVYNESYPKPEGTKHYRTLYTDVFDIHHGQILMEANYQLNTTSTHHNYVEKRDIDTMGLVERVELRYHFPSSISFEDDIVVLHYRYFTHLSTNTSFRWGLSVLTFGTSEELALSEPVSTTIGISSTPDRDPLFTYGNLTEPISVHNSMVDGDRYYRLMGLDSFDELEISPHNYTQAILGLEVYEVSSIYPGEILPELLARTVFIAFTLLNQYRKKGALDRQQEKLRKYCF